MSQTVSFTGFELDVSDLKRSRVHPLPVPKGWSRVKVEFTQFGALDKLVNWVLLNIPGRFGYLNNHPHVILYFEDASAGILFKMLDGEHACLDA